MSRNEALFLPLSLDLGLRVGRRSKSIYSRLSCLWMIDHGRQPGRISSLTPTLYKASECRPRVGHASSGALGRSGRLASPVSPRPFFSIVGRMIDGVSTFGVAMAEPVEGRPMRNSPPCDCSADGIYSIRDIHEQQVTAHPIDAPVSPKHVPEAAPPLGFFGVALKCRRCTTLTVPSATG